MLSNLVRQRSFVLLCLICGLIPLAAQSQGDYYDEYPVMEGEGITIVGSASTTQHMEIIDRETIERTHAADIPSLLQETLGLVIPRYGPYGNDADIHLRGFSLKRIAILVDGVPVNSTASGGFDFYSIDPNSIERIEVIYGGSDTKFNVSGALGGIINIVTVKKHDPGWSIGGSISNTSYLPGQFITPNGETRDPQWQDLVDAQRISLFTSYGGQAFSFRANAFGNRAGNHFLYTSYNDLRRRKEGNEILDAGASVSFIWELPDLSTFIASGSFYYGDKNIPTSGYSFVYAEQKDTAARESLMLQMPRAFHDDLSMELSLSHNWRYLSYDPGTSASLHNEHMFDVINRWGWHPSSAITFRFGGDYRFIRLDSTDTKLVNAHRAGLYLTSEFSPTENLLLIASVKGMTNGLEIVPIPKIGLAWKLNDYLTIKNNYFRSFKFPDFNDLYWISDGYTGNPDLKSEDGWGADLSVLFSLQDLLTFNTTVYGQWIQDSIHWSDMSGVWRTENSGEAVFVGLDTKLELILPFSPGPLNNPVFGISWVFQLSWLLSGSLSFDDNRRIPYMPMHIIGVSLELPWETGSLVISGHFEGSRFTETGNIRALDPHFLLNIIYNQKINKNFGIFGKANNILNTNYVSFADYPMPGISITLGANMLFTGLGTSKE